MEIDMEKRLRDCTRHMENLDYAALSQEDIEKETGDILIQIGFLQNDLILCRIRSGVLIICAVLAVIAVLASQTLPFYIFGIIMLALMVWSLNVFIKRNKGVNQLYRLYDKLSRL